MAARLSGLGALAFRRRAIVLGAWMVILALAAMAALTLRGPADNSFSVPGTESQQALDLLSQKFPGTGGADARIVFAAPAGHTLAEPAYQSLLVPTVAAARKVPQTVPGAADAFGHSVHVSADQTIAYADLSFAVPVDKLTDATKQALQDVAQPARNAGLEVEFSGGVIATSTSGGISDVIGVAVALVVLVVAFWAFIAAALPLVTALLGIGIGLLAITAATGVFGLNSTAPTLALMLGLAVGIDYALFIVSRIRQNLDAGHAVAAAVARAAGTAGAAVTFAAVTVVVALTGLSVVGIPFLSAMGLAAAFTVGVALLIALTLLPAIAGFAASRIGRTMRRPGAPAFGRRWAQLVTRRPLAALLAVLAVFAVAALPALHLSTGLPDDGTKPTSTTERRAYDLLTRGFGPGFNGPLTVVVDASGRQDAANVGEAALTALKQVPDVAAVEGPAANPSNDVFILQVTPKSGPSDQATSDLVHYLRARAAPVKADYGISAYVTGSTAINIDTSAKLNSALPIFLALVVGLAFLLLLVVFRSLLVPLVAVVGFLLTIAAALGATTFVFQDGHLLSMFGAAAAPITSFVPVLAVAILFGLSMDYEVFLVSRMREAYAHGEDPRSATISGFAASARVVTAAALIMVSVFASFMLEQDVVVKQIAFALAFGILFDAFLIRMTVIPAVHRLLGRAAWWLPNRVDRVLPDLDIEGARLETVPVRTKELATAGQLPAVHRLRG